MERYLGIILIVITTLFAKNILQSPTILGTVPYGTYLGDSTPSPTKTLPVNQPITTESSFIQKLEEEVENIPRKTVYEDDTEMEVGEEKVMNEGEDGKKTKIIKITFHRSGGEYEREIVSVETTPPKDKKILRGTKIVWRNMDTPDGQIQYWKKMRVYATHYDSNCPGCNEWTAIGLRAGKGIIAVDPRVIPLKSRVYIPGYGMAVAGDTGGAIKGNIIDLGFDDAKTSGWTARFVDIYLL